MISILTLPFNEKVRDSLPRLGAATVYGVSFVSLAIYVLIVRSIAHGRRNWLRWTLLILTLIGLPYAAMEWPSEVSRYPVYVAASLVDTFLSLFAMYLVFTGDARPWFQKSVPSAN